MTLETLFGVALIANIYVLVYYRLMVRFHQQKQADRPQKTAAALLSIPPYRSLSERGRQYARRWWIALGVMSTVILTLATRLEF